LRSLATIQRGGDLRVREVRRAHHRDEQLDLDALGGGRVDRQLLAGVVDEALLAGLVDLAHHDVEPLRPVVVEGDELRVAVATGARLQVLLVEQP
jgi:hypothetical protein